MNFKNFYLSMWNLSDLEDLYRVERDRKVKLRFLCAIHRKRGDTIVSIAQKVCLPRSTVFDYLRRFESGVRDCLYDRPQPGKRPLLDESQFRHLEKVLTKSPVDVGLEVDFWSTSLVRKFIQKEFGPKYTMFGTRKLLKRLGFSLQKPRPIHHKGKEEEQTTFKKNSNELSRYSKTKATKYCFWTKAPF